MEEKTKNLTESFQNLEGYYIHPQLQNALKSMQTCLAQLMQIQVQTRYRTVEVVPQDLKKFLKSWLLVKDLVMNFAGATISQQFAKRLSTLRQTNVPAPPTLSDQMKDVKEKKGIEGKIFNALQDLRNVMEDLVHTHVYYHAKSLEAWDQVWTALHANEKTEKVATSQSFEKKQTAGSKRTMIVQDDDDDEDEEDDEL